MHLCNWIASKIPFKETGGRTGNRLYQQLCDMVSTSSAGENVAVNVRLERRQETPITVGLRDTLGNHGENGTRRTLLALISK